MEGASNPDILKIVVRYPLNFVILLIASKQFRLEVADNVSVIAFIRLCAGVFGHDLPGKNEALDSGET